MARAAPQRAAGMRREDRGGKAAVAVIGDGDGLLDAFHGDHRQHRPEDFLGRETAVRRHTVKDGRGDIIASTVPPTSVSTPFPASADSR